jgi:hypothetical protein
MQDDVTMPAATRRAGPPPPRPRAAARCRMMALPLAVLVAAGCNEPIAPEESLRANLRVDTDAVQLVSGESRTVVAYLRGDAGQIVALPPGTAVTWSTSNAGVATVTNGVITAGNPGQAEVTARSGSLGTATVAVTVVEGFLPLALGTMGGARSNAWAVNDAGVVAGWADVSGGRPFRWVAGAGATDFLGLPGGTRGINAAGDITGYYNMAAGGQRGYVFRNGARFDLPPLQQGHSTSGISINDSGTVAGRSHGWAVVWHRAEDGSYGQPVSLGLHSPSHDPAINNRGDVIFTVWRNGFEPVLWRVQADGSYGEPLLLGRPAPGEYTARGINDAGSIVGVWWNGVAEIAVLWHHANYDQPIGLGEGDAWAINARHQIVGTAGGDLPVFGGAPRRPVMWTLGANGTIAMVDLGTPAGFASGGARAISDAGLIAGSSWGPGAVVATLWRPSP